MLTTLRTLLVARHKNEDIPCIYTTQILQKSTIYKDTVLRDIKILLSWRVAAHQPQFFPKSTAKLTPTHQVYRGERGGAGLHLHLFDFLLQKFKFFEKKVKQNLKKLKDFLEKSLKKKTKRFRDIW